MGSPIIVSASYDKEIRFWDVALGRTVRKTTFEESQVNCMHLCLNDRYLMIGGSCVLRVFDLEAETIDSDYPAIGNVAKFECSGPMNFTSIGSFRLRKDAFRSLYGGMEDSVFYNMTVVGCATESDLSLVIYATSEDGCIRFFNGITPGNLPVIKTIRTGAAITCSALSPDNRFLLVGNQLGQVSLWHIPSVVVGIARDSKISKSSTQRNSLIDAALQADSIEPEVNLFGDRPLQTISFAYDYSAVRSIAISPVGWWGVAATNCGNLHFMCLSVYATTSTQPGHPPVDSVTQPFENQDFPPITAKNGGRDSDDSVQRVRLSTYASALEANNQRVSKFSSHDAADSSLHSNTISPATIGVSAQKDDLSSRNIDAAEAALLGAQNVQTTAPNENSSPKTQLQRQLMMEVFHSFQGHYKYILKVCISPNNTLIATCSADFSVGRFTIPKELQEWRMSEKTFDEAGEAASESDYRPIGFSQPLAAAVDQDSDAKSLQSLDEKHVDPAEMSQGASENAEFRSSTGKEKDASKTEIPAKGKSGSLQGIQFKSVRSLVGHVRWVWDCTFSACSNYIFSAGSDAVVRMWSNKEGSAGSVFNGHSKPVVSVLLYYEQNRKRR